MPQRNHLQIYDTATPSGLNAGPPLQTFFDAYPTFTYDPSGSPIHEFGRMCQFFGWHNAYTTARKKAYTAFRRALVDEFNAKFGTDANKLAPWRALCQTIGISPIPESVTKCKKAMKAVHVNLVDLVDPSLANKKIHKFRNVHELAAYTQETGKIFPKNAAKAGGVLKYLLREIF
ncbi:hypothetical protein OF83DRAFT_1088352 [Amylostereum chailletii]|nr:hypothetical protein OF83DRAFT_1088352 [Amylostereum chailletii]